MAVFKKKNSEIASLIKNHGMSSKILFSYNCWF